MNKQRIIWHRILDQPMHRPNNIRLRRLTQRIILIIRQNHHILPTIAVNIVEENRHLSHVVDASFQLVGLTKVVDANQQRFSLSGAIGVLELVA